jgi:hypothetical protein
MGLELPNLERREPSHRRSHPRVTVALGFRSMGAILLVATDAH